jgi:hypothetical protein
MSNPLAMFRKHQKILLAVFGVALMIVFSIGTIVSEYMGTTQPMSSDEVVVKLATGDLRERDLRVLQRDRMILRQFMQLVRMTAAQQGATPQQTLGIPDTDDESNLVQTAVLADQAREMGIVVSDEAIVDFLMSYTEGTMERGDFARILNTVTNRTVSQRELMNAMRREMLAMRFVGLFQRGVLPPTPTAAWDYYKRLNLKASFEAVPFEAEDYLAKVSDPADAEVRRVYEEGKDSYPLPDRPQPGFKRLKKVAVEYVKGELDDFLPAAKAAITDEEVAAYYEANKNVFRNVELPDVSEFGTPSDWESSETDADTAPTDDAPAAEEADDAVSQDTAAEDTAEPQTTEIEQPEGEPTTEPAESSDATDPLDPQPLQDDPADDGPKQNSAPETTGTGDAGAPNEQPVAEQDVTEITEEAPGQDSAADETPEAETAETESPEAETAGTESAESESPEAETAETESPEAESAEVAPPDAEMSPTDTESSLDDVFDFGVGEGPNARPEFKPLEEVADEIRTSLARPIARQKLDEAFNTVRAAMRSYYGSYIAWEIGQEQGEKSDRPESPDLRTLAGQNGLEYGQTPLVDVLQLQETDLVTGEPLYEISRAYDMNFVSFAQQAFSDSLGKFEIRTISGQAVDSEYLFWKTDDRAEYVPEFDEAKPEVVRAIKMKEAIKLAKQARRKRPSNYGSRINALPMRFATMRIAR